MMRYGKTGIVAGVDPNDVAACLARSDDDVQSEFFRVFLKELRVSCGTSYNTEMQLAFVRAKLSKEDREELRMLGLRDDE